MAALSTGDVVNHDNYLWVKKFLQYLADTVGRPKGTIDRYWFYLCHLLIWADSVLFQLAQNIRPVFKLYLTGDYPQVVLPPQTVVHEM
jgi:hypothetical protein